MKIFKLLTIFICMVVALWFWSESVSATPYETRFDIGQLTSKVDWSDWSMSTDEKIMQVGILLDVLQTERIHKEDCYYEANPITRRQIGRQPSTEKVIMWGLASAAVTHYTFKFIENSNMPQYVQKAIKYANIVYRYDTVYNNHQIGIRIGAPAKVQMNEQRYCN